MDSLGQLLVLRKLDTLLHWWPGGWHQKLLISQMSERWTQDPSPSSHSASQCILWLVSVVSSSMHPWETTMIAGENRLSAALSHLSVSADLTKDWAIAVGHVKAMKFIDYVYWCPAIVSPNEQSWLGCYYNGLFVTTTIEAANAINSLRLWHTMVWLLELMELTCSFSRWTEMLQLGNVLQPRYSQGNWLARGGWRIFMKLHSKKACLH